MGLHLRCDPYTFGPHRCSLVGISNKGLDTLLGAGCGKEPTTTTYEKSSIHDDRFDVRAYRDAFVGKIELSIERLDQSGCAKYLDTQHSFYFEGAGLYRSWRSG